MWVLGTKCWSSERAANVLSCWAISSVPRAILCPTYSISFLKQVAAMETVGSSPWRYSSSCWTRIFLEASGRNSCTQKIVGTRMKDLFCCYDKHVTEAAQKTAKLSHSLMVQASMTGKARQQELVAAGHIVPTVRRGAGGGGEGMGSSQLNYPFYLVGIPAHWMMPATLRVSATTLINPCRHSWRFIS